MTINPEITLIVPVYNASIYLRRCIDSIINQTLNAIEIILIDDGSTDDSYEICSEYARQDHRIKLEKQLNSGQSYARNKGLEIAEAPYIMFVDSDDWIDSDTCKSVLDTMKNENADIVMFTYSREYEGKSLKKYIYDGDKIFNEKECKRLHRRFAGIICEELSNPENSDSLAPVCTKLYKASIIKENNLFFEDIREIVSYEDGLFNLNYFCFVNKAVYLDIPFYKYWRVNWSSTTKKYFEDVTLKFKVLFGKIDHYIKENNLSADYATGLRNRIALNLITVCLKTVSDSNPLTFIQKLKFISNVLQDELYFSAIVRLETKRMPVHWKFYYWAAKHRLALVILILAFIIKHKVNR